MNKVLVTGAAGYVGREVVLQLLEQGKEVVALVRSPSYDLTPSVRVDFTDAAALEKALEGVSFDTIIHLASLPGDTGDPQEMIRVNVNGCLNMLEVARQRQVERFVHSSSISSYEWYPATPFNPPDYMPVDENHPCRPRDIYSTSKRMQELLVLTYYHQYKVPATSLRLTAVIGPRGRGGGRGWREIAEAMAGGKSVQVPHFSAEELCHYVDLRDAARMHIVAAEHPGAVGEIFNCCGPQPNRGSDFVTILQDLIPGITVQFGFPWSMAQGGEVSFDMTKAERLLGFKPQYKLEDSLKHIKAWIDAGGLQADTGDQGKYGKGVATE